MAERWRDLKLSGDTVVDSLVHSDESKQFYTSKDGLVNPAIGRGIDREKFFDLRLPASLAKLGECSGRRVPGHSGSQDNIVSIGLGRGQVVQSGMDFDRPVGFTRAPKSKVRRLMYFQKQCSKTTFRPFS